MKLFSLIFVAVVFCLMSATYIQSAPIQGLVLYLSFDEGSGTVANDLSGLNNNGALKGVPKWVKGKSGTALQFDGAENKNYVEIQDNPSLNPATEITIAVWVYIERFVGSGGIVSKYIGANNQRGYSLRMDHSSVWAVASDTSTDGTYAGGMYTTTSTPANALAESKWQHVTMTFKAKQFHRLYVDGELKKETKDSVIPKLFDNNVPLYIGTDFQIGGQHAAGQPREFTGTVDEVVLFNRAISDTEIKTVMEGRIAILSVEPYRKLSSMWGEIKKF